MVDVITEQIFSFIEKELFSFLEIGAYYKRLKMKSITDAFEMFRNEVIDLEFLKDAVYCRVMILEPSSKSIFIKKFSEILSEYNDNEIIASVGLEILRIKGIKPQFKNKYEGIGFGLLSDIHKLEFYNLNELDFDFDKEQKLLSDAYLIRFNKFKEFILDYSQEYIEKNSKTEVSNKVFIVHGHNNGIKFEVSQALIKVGVKPIILHEQSSESKTIIEKIEANSDVKYAIILLTDDDVGKSKSEENLKPRARQNVIFEMGYFIGLLGRENVCCIINNASIEKPSDINGIVYIEYSGNWILEIAKELRNVGYEIDMNNLI